MPDSAGLNARIGLAIARKQILVRVNCLPFQAGPQAASNAVSKLASRLLAFIQTFFCASERGFIEGKIAYRMNALFWRLEKQAAKMLEGLAK